MTPLGQYPYNNIKIIKNFFITDIYIEKLLTIMNPSASCNYLDLVLLYDSPVIHDSSSGIIKYFK